MSTLTKDRRFYAILGSNLLSSIGLGISGAIVPWTMINLEGGEKVFGYTTLVTMLVVFFLSPYTGVLVDRFSRKKTLLITEMAGFIVTGIIATMILMSGGIAIWELVILKLASTLYYSIQIPAMFAMSQELFDKSQYNELNSAMEVQGQTATMASAGLAALLIDKIDMQYILIFDACTYLVAFLLILTIPYTKQKKVQAIKNATVWQDSMVGFRFLRARPLMFWFLICSFIPFIIVMVDNYINPIYVKNDLQADPSIYALSSLIYSIGAIAVSLVIPFIMKRFGSLMTCLITMGIFTLGISLIVIFPISIVFLLAQINLGIGNAGTRVARNTIMMEKIPNELIGRITSFISAIGLLIRMLLIGFFTNTIQVTGATFSFTVASVILIAAMVGVLMTKSFLTQREVS